MVTNPTLLDLLHAQHPDVPDLFSIYLSNDPDDSKHSSRLTFGAYDLSLVGENATWHYTPIVKRGYGDFKYRGRAEALLVGSGFAMAFKRTAPAVRRCKNQQHRCSYGRDWSASQVLDREDDGHGRGGRRRHVRRHVLRHRRLGYSRPRRKRLPSREIRGRSAPPPRRRSSLRGLATSSPRPVSRRTIHVVAATVSPRTSHVVVAASLVSPRTIHVVAAASPRPVSPRTIRVVAAASPPSRLLPAFPQARRASRCRTARTRSSWVW